MDQVVAQALTLYAKLSGARNLSAAIGRRATALRHVALRPDAAAAAASV
jgi:hypothetical protein